MENFNFTFNSIDGLHVEAELLQSHINNQCYYTIVTNDSGIIDTIPVLYDSNIEPDVFDELDHAPPPDVITEFNRIKKVKQEEVNSPHHPDNRRIERENLNDY